LEYLKRISDAFRVYLGVEGSQDDAGLIPELQVFVTPGIYLKLNGGLGTTSKAADFTPELGIMFVL